VVKRGQRLGNTDQNDARPNCLAQKPLKHLIDDQVTQNGMLILPVKFDHVLRLESLPGRHKDPFDRLLVAQALEENCVLVSHDPMIAQYPVTTIW
jgi:PIN domain nuclease of toxin-antitoxin system